LAGRLTITGGGWLDVDAGFAPQQGTVYDIGHFTPARFAAEGVA